MQARPQYGRTRLGRFATFSPVLSLGVLLTASLNAQVTVTQTALETVFNTLALDHSELSELPLGGAGQKVRFAMLPEPSGLTVPGTTLAGTTVTVPVTVTVVKWTVRSGNAAGSELCAHGTAGCTDAGYKIFDDDPSKAARSFVFKTTAVHYTDDASPAKDPFTVQLEVQLSAGNGPTVITNTLSRESLKVPRIGVPKILALFRHPDFAPTKNGIDGFLLVLLPSNTPLSTLPGIKNYLDDLQDAVTNLSWVTSFAGSATQVAGLRSEIGGHPHTQLRIGGRRNLHDITMVDHRFGVDVHASDAVSSLMFLADDGYRSYFFNNEEYRKNEGYFWVEAGAGSAMVVRVPTLHSSNPPSVPSGHLDRRCESDTGTFGNKLSSIRFSAPDASGC